MFKISASAFAEKIQLTHSGKWLRGQYDDSVRSGRSMRRQIEDMDICGLMTHSGNGSDFIVLTPACFAWISYMVLVSNQYPLDRVMRIWILRTAAKISFKR